MEVCITAPASASGTVPVSGTTTVVAGSPAGTMKMEFLLGGKHLITDYSAPFTFSLYSQDFADAPSSIAARAILRDATYTSPAEQPITFDNGNATVPVNTATFTTPTAPAPPAPQPFVIAATGDGAGGEPAATNVSDMIVSWNPSMFSYLGDVYEDGTLTEMRNWYGGGSTWFSRLRSITAPVVGNHEYNSAPGGGYSAEGYFHYWDNVPHRYSYDAGGWHFVALDSTNQFGQTAAGSDQYDWLAADLAANPGACTIVSYHHPYKNIGPERPTDRMDDIWALLRQHKVTLVLNGHDHNYQRWAPLDGTGMVQDPHGVTELVIGGGGHGTQPFVATDPLVQFSAASLGAARIELRPDRADISYRTPDGGSGKEQDHAIVPCQGLPEDTQAPGAPTEVTATPDSTPSAAWTAAVSWSAATDDRAVAQYRIYRDGVAVATVPAAQTSWHDGGLTYSTTYHYRVSALDAAGNESALSADTPVTTGPPSASSTLTFQPIDDTYVSQANPNNRYGTATTLRASNSSTAEMISYLRFDLSGLYSTVTSVKLQLSATAKALQGATVSRAGTAWNDGASTAPTYTSKPTVGTQIAVVGPYGNGASVVADITDSATVTGNGTYAFALKSLSSSQINWASVEAGTATAPRLVVTSQPPPDTQAPTVPQGLTAGSAQETVASLSWTGSTDAIGVGSYRIYRNGTLLDTVPGTVTSYSDVTVSPGIAYSYAVAAVDAAGNASAQSVPAAVTPPDLTAPEPMETFSAVLDDATTARLVWSPATDNVGVTGYRVLRDGTEVALLPGSASGYVQSGLSAQTTYVYTVNAVDAVGNTSDPVSGSVTTPSAGNGTPPTVPTGLTATAAGENAVDLSWTASTDDVEVAAYEVYRDGTSVIVLPGGQTSWQDTGLTAASTHQYAVRAGDGDGNWSDQSASASVTTGAPDTQAPSTPTALTGTGGSTTSVQLSWAASTDDRGVTGYGIYRDGSLVASVEGGTSSYSDTGLAVGSTHNYTVDAVDAAGNRSAPTSSVSVRTQVPPDVTSTVTAVADAYVNSANPGSKYGSATALRINGTTTSEMHTFLRFTPTGSLPVIKSAILTLGATSKVSALVVRTAPGTWSESTLSWSVRPTPYGQTQVTSPGLPAAGQLTIDVTPLVASAAQVDLVITTTSTTQSAFSSREAAAPAVPPTLQVTSGY